MVVRAPADKRFRRSHVSPARTRRLRPPNWRVTITAAAALGIILYLGYHAVALALSANALVIERITVSGNVRLSRGEVVALLDGLRGQNMLTTSIERWRQQLKRSPWVADAAIRRMFPGTVDVVILEREPIGIGRVGEELYLVDREGSIIDAFGPNYAELDLPLIGGLGKGQADGGLLVDQRRAALAGRLFDALAGRRDLLSRISEVDVTDVHDAVVILKNDTAVIRVGDDHFLRRLEAYSDLGPTLRERVPDIDYVDLRFDDRVYVRPRGKEGEARAREGEGVRGKGSGLSQGAGVREQESGLSQFFGPPRELAAKGNASVQKPSATSKPRRRR